MSKNIQARLLNHLRNNQMPFNNVLWFCMNDKTVEEVLSDLRSSIIEDSRFEGVEKIEMEVLPPTLSITISAILANGRGVFPINFTV